ncbi:hypothetical protein Vadar_028694 [Vaccinium darrowii]|uniref:Uncharacterized protein n=1 Tax=Vaccinium darrowii TaxID=229202 RepID=A0ACB7YQV2_9ERIC|nr:hypothetical protein Vadar_028694 [Vaccinium darrowii]
MEKVNEREEDGYDAIVVGSGYGGSVAACRTAMAGVKVCLLEKGRKWESKDFPTNSLEILTASRVENKNLGLSFGPKDALFQAHTWKKNKKNFAQSIGRQVLHLRRIENVVVAYNCED